MLTLVYDNGDANHQPLQGSGQSLLDEIVRDGARQMLASALQAEVAAYGPPEIFNTGQGAQFTSILANHGIQISIDGRGRWLDNVFIERLWRSVKYEEVYLKAYENGIHARQSLEAYFQFYNSKRHHQSLDRTTPDQVYNRKPSLIEGGPNLRQGYT